MEFINEISFEIVKDWFCTNYCLGFNQCEHFEQGEKRMYIVNDKLPKDCFECEFRTKCNVWEAFLRLPIDMAEIKTDDLELLKPMRYRNCKIHKVPSWIARLYFKYIKGKCKHLCYTCKHKKKCELYLYGRE